MLRTRFQILALATVSSMSLLLSVPSALADEAWQKITLERAKEIILEAYDASDELAESVGGYELRREQEFSDGATYESASDYTVEGSVSFLDRLWSAEGKQTASSHYIYLSSSETLAFAPVASDVRAEFKLLGVPKGSWLIEENASYGGPSMKEFQGWPSSDVFYMLETTNDMRTAMWNESARLLRIYGVDWGGDEERIGEIRLRPDGAISSYITDFDPWGDDGYQSRSGVLLTFNYVKPIVKLPSSITMVNIEDYRAAQQSLHLEDWIRQIGHYVTNPPTSSELEDLNPRKVQLLTKKAVRFVRVTNDFVLATSVKRTKTGAKLFIEVPLRNQRAIVKIKIGNPPNYSDRAFVDSWRIVAV